MAVVFFIYGLAFFILGFAIVLYPKKGSGFALAKRLWLIGVFGLVHGINEWVDMFILLSGPDALPVLNVIRVPLLVISFSGLLLFGIMTITHDGKAHKPLIVLPAVLITLWGVVVLMSEQMFLSADIWGRYLLGAPGIFLTSYALTTYETEIKNTGLIRARNFLRFAAVLFFLYGILSGVIVPSAGFFPNTVVNYETFIRVFDVPVQVFRSICAVGLTICFLYILGIFEWESKDNINRAYDELEDRVQQRTTSLIEVNEQLEAEIAERIKVESTLKKSQESFETILEATPYGIVIVGLDKTIRYANPAALQYMGYTRLGEIVGRTCHNNMCPAQEGHCPIIDEGMIVDRSERFLINKSGERIPILKSVRRVNLGGEEVLIEAFIDISERKKAEEDKERLEEQLLHAQKMEAIGTLTGGIAHDFNNILTAVIGYGEFLKDEMDESDPRRAYVDMIVASGEKGAKLTQSLLAFSRKQVIKPKPIDLNNVVRLSEVLLSRLIGEDIELKIKCTDRELIVRADSVRMEQILMNLVTNARDAMPDGGKVSITTEEVALNGAFIHEHGFGIPGRYALLTVSDTGKGMDEKTQELIFEPFFTTKDVGKGTGLGLSVVYGLIKQHGGFINVYSELNLGTSFKIYLPLVDEKVTDVVAAPSELKGGSETLLVAEDDDNVRKLLTRVLEKSGYTVITASNGGDAVKLYQENKDDIKLLVLDMVMPVKSGIDAYEEIRKIRPGIKALFISGYPTEILQKRGITDESLNLLTKPVSPTETLSKIRSLLDS